MFYSKSNDTHHQRRYHHMLLCLAGDVKGSLGDAQNSAASVSLDTEPAPFAPGTQKRKIEGDVLRWHLASDSAESIPALEYIHMLERENAELKKQVSDSAIPGNPLEHMHREIELMQFVLTDIT